MNLDSIKVHCGDCLDVLATLPENSVDSAVTDPPYHLTSIVKRFGAENAAPPISQVQRRFNKTGAAMSLGPDGKPTPDQYGRLSKGFMGKQWDGGDIAQSVDLWRQVYRVLKPGAHLLAFGGTRTYHRMACAIEDAGFEIRDCIQWLYGSGFPKSHDVSKGIDRANGKHERNLQPFGEYVKSCRIAQGWTLGQLDERMGTNTAASWWEGRKSGVQPPGLEQYRRLKLTLNMDDRFDDLIEWAEAQREIVGQKIWDNSANHFVPGEDHTQRVHLDETAPATDAARQWEGWGTALKPACEPIVLARKPLSEKTVAANVLRWGTGAINVDGCRVASEPIHTTRNTALGIMNDDSWQPKSGIFENHANGRWPANIIHDGSEEVLAGFPESDQTRTPRNGTGDGGIWNESVGRPAGNDIGDTGSAARFFACFPQEKPESAPNESKRFWYTSKADADDRIGSKHPTVKPLDLMQYLVRLVTPKGGTCLDPFAGTGTTGEAAFREGMKAVLIEREAEYQVDIHRRIELLMAGPDERSRESIKARGLTESPGPLFDSQWDEMWSSPFDKPELVWGRK